MRRILIILAILIVLVGCGIGIYFAFFSGSIETPATGLQVGLPLAGGQAPGAGPQNGGGAVATTSPSAPGTVASVLGQLVKISGGPVVPGVLVTDIRSPSVASTTVASSTGGASVSYIERESGNVFSYLTNSKILTRTSNRTVPGLQDAAWLPDASAALVRYLSGDTFSTINTYALPASSAATTSNGFFLPQDLGGVAASATGILMTASGVTGTSVSLSRLDGTRPTTLFATPLTAIQVSFAGKDTYLVFSKASSGLSGYAFLVDSAGRFTRIAGPLIGLTALASPSGKWVFLSFVRDGIPQTALFNSKDGTTIPLPIGTLTEKCAWAANDTALYCGVPTTTSASNLYPDDWYQGVVHFSDRLWRIDVSGRYAQMILDFQEVSGETLDAMSLALDPAQTTLVFLNKNDGSLWSYSL